MTEALQKRIAHFGIAAALTIGFSLAACQMDSHENDPNSSEQPAPDQVRIGGIMWYVDYEAAVKIARKQDKSLWVHFGENPG